MDVTVIVDVSIGSRCRWHRAGCLRRELIGGRVVERFDAGAQRSKVVYRVHERFPMGCGASDDDEVPMTAGDVAADSPGTSGCDARVVSSCWRMQCMRDRTVLGGMSRIAATSRLDSCSHATNTSSSKSSGDKSARAAMPGCQLLRPSLLERGVRLDGMSERVGHDVIGDIASHTTCRIRVDRRGVGDIHRVHLVNGRHQLGLVVGVDLNGRSQMRRYMWHFWYSPAASWVFTSSVRQVSVRPLRRTRYRSTR